MIQLVDSIVKNILVYSAKLFYYCIIDTIERKKT